MRQRVLPAKSRRMLSFRLTNFRSFGDTSVVTLRPITVLVGANSSGKSSCLRFFPLLRQSVEARSRSPLLWFGDYVDFGDFRRALNRRIGIEEIGVELALKISPNERRPLARREARDLVATIHLTLGEHSERTFVHECVLNCFSDTCRIRFDPMGRVVSFQVNQENILEVSPHYVGLESVFVPTITYVNEATDSRYEEDPHIISAIASLLKPFAHNRMKDSTLRSYARSLPYDDAQVLADAIKRLKLRHFDQLGNRDRERLRALVLARATPRLLEGASRAVQSFARAISYVGPFRHNPERFYRQQDLSVAQIDPQGKNLAMFLRALSEHELASLSQFVHQHLGMRLRLDSESSHVTISLTDEAGNSFNLIDMGYGFSQILPIIAQCWAAGRQGRRADQIFSMLAIEQPELHLHPLHQAKLADMFVAVLDSVREQIAADSRPPIVPAKLKRELPIILVETHSEVLLNRFGELVESGRLDSGDVSVLLVQREPTSGLSKIVPATFAPSGVLLNWPLGFFSPA